MSNMETFDDIYLDLSRQAGRCRFADSGLGWKPSGGGETSTWDGNNITSAQWSRASRGYEVKVFLRDGSLVQLDGFPQEEFDRLNKLFKSWYGVNLESREIALRGWNWGKADFTKSELTFNVQSRPAFQIPFTQISNTNLAGKNEVAVELSLPTGKENGTTNGTTDDKKRGNGARDELVEMRFYIPGTETTITKQEKDSEGDGGDGEEEEVEEEQNAANVFYETLRDKAEVGETAGDSIAIFEDILCLTPRGRFDISLYDGSFRLRGKTYDYKVQYDAMKKFMLLPKPDDVHILITVGLEPPLRQGQTRYPFLVMQFKRDEEVQIDLNMSEEQLNDEKYKGKLQATYEAPQHNVLAQIFRGLAGKKIITPSKDFSSHHSQSGVKCSIKANEGHLFCLDKSFMFVPKPATYIAFDNIREITMSRVGGASSASRTFDLNISTKGGQGDYQFSNINREEQKSLEEFFEAKHLKWLNEMEETVTTLANLDPDLASSDDEQVAGADRGSADEDSEEADEDFEADSSSEPADEFDSDAGSSGDEEMGEGSGDDDTEAKVERPKKKQKTGK